MSCSKIDIRPQINHIANTENKHPEEKFQNLTLRPILKMQHELLVAGFLHYLAKNKMDIHGLAQEKREALITRIFKNDHVFKTEMRGLIIGHFTLDEYHKYIEMYSEINRRILTMCADRVQSAF